MVTITALNGRLPAALLVTIDAKGNRLAIVPAASIRRCWAAGMPAGGVREGYRDYATQERYYRDPPNHLGLAAVPGQSQHGEGVAVDLDDPQSAWMAAHPEHGWRRTIRRETWHWEHYPNLDVAARASTSSTAPTVREDDMYMIRRGSSGSVALIGPGYYDVLPEAEVRIWTTIIGSGPLALASADYDAAISRLTEGSIWRKVWATTVARGTEQITALQELADAKTLAAAIQKALAAAPSGGAAPADLAPVLAAIKALPAQTIEALKAALA